MTRLNWQFVLTAKMFAILNKNVLDCWVHVMDYSYNFTRTILWHAKHEKGIGWCQKQQQKHSITNTAQTMLRLCVCVCALRVVICFCFRWCASGITPYAPPVLSVFELTAPIGYIRQVVYPIASSIGAPVITSGLCPTYASSRYEMSTYNSSNTFFISPTRQEIAKFAQHSSAKLNNSSLINSNFYSHNMLDVLFDFLLTATELLHLLH